MLGDGPFALGTLRSCGKTPEKSKNKNSGLYSKHFFRPFFHDVKLWLAIFTTGHILLLYILCSSA